MKYLLLFTMLLIRLSTFGQEQAVTRLDGSIISPPEIDRLVERLMDTANVQGMNLAVLNANKTVFVKSYGFRNKPKNLAMDNASIVYAASFSKAVFGYLLMALVDKNLIDLDRPLDEYLEKPIPEYSYFSDLKNDERWKLITARMCLDHTTGLPNVRYFDPTSADAVFDSLGVIKFYFNPGEKYAYSGEAYKLLQLAIEEITHKTTDELAQELIFQPLGMDRTGYVWHESFGDENVAVGHANDGGIDFKRKRTVAVSGGSLVTCITDYAKFIEHVMQRKGISPKAYEEMLSPQIAIHSVTQFPPVTQEITTENDAIKLSYGLGWGLMTCSFGKAFFKEGNGGAWKNYNVNFPDNGIAIIIMTNSENGETIYQELIEQLIGNTCIPWKWQDYVSYKDLKKKE